MAFYVDDKKVIRRDPKVVNDVIASIENYFGKLTVESGNEFNFLGIDIKIRKDEKI